LFAKNKELRNRSSNGMIIGQLRRIRSSIQLLKEVLIFHVLM